MKNIQELLKDNKFFQQGIEKFKEGQVEALTVAGSWVKNKIAVVDWNGYYSRTGNYCFLARAKDGVMVAFLAVNPDPDCELLTGEEMRRMDDLRKAGRIAPRPFEEV